MQFTMFKNKYLEHAAYVFVLRSLEVKLLRSPESVGVSGISDFIAKGGVKTSRNCSCS
jgi:hypothetical protein